MDVLTDAQIGPYSRIRRCIVNAGFDVPEGTVVGFDSEADRAAGYHVTETGIVVLSD